MRDNAVCCVYTYARMHIHMHIHIHNHMHIHVHEVTTTLTRKGGEQGVEQEGKADGQGSGT